MELHLQDKHVIVTGGSRGIGKAIVTSLLEEGARVAFCARNEWEANLFPERFDGRWQGEKLDILNPDATSGWIRSLAEQWGTIDILINNAGRSIPGSFATLSEDDWRTDIEVKLLGPMRLIRASLPFMEPGGNVINISAVFGKQPDSRFFASSVNRAASASLVKTLSQELAERGIRVNGVNIGFVFSGQWEGRTPEFFSSLVENYRVSLKRFGSPEEVASVVLFLASCQASYMTGTLIDVDGGMARYL